MFRYAIALLVLGPLLTPLHAGQFNKKISIGDAAPKFSKLPGVDGKEYSLDSFKDKDVFVIVLTANTCPVAQLYDERILAFAKKFGGGKSKVGILALSVSLLDGDSLAKMKEQAREKKYTFPYVRDESQELGKALGATVTPEFWVFDKDRKLVYMGAMDDDISEPKVNYLEAAVEAALKGQKVETAETRPSGCSVEYKKTAPSVELKTVNYDALKAAVRAQRGKVVVVDIWSSTCIPCMEAFPAMLDMQRRLEKEGLVCLSVAIEPGSRAAAQKFLDKQNAKIANYWLDEKPDIIQQRFDMNGPPVVFVFDRQGRRAAKFDHNNPDKQFDHTDIEKLVQQLLKDK